MRSDLWNMFTTIKNGQIARKSFVEHPRKKICEKFLTLLWKENYILGYTIINDRKIKIFLKYYNNGNPAINSLEFISKPGRRIYFSANEIWKLDSTKYFILYSTNKGLKTSLECKKLNIGGEPLVIIN